MYKKAHIKWASSDFVFIFYMDYCHLKRQLNLLRLLLLFYGITRSHFFLITRGQFF